MKRTYTDLACDVLAAHSKAGAMGWRLAPNPGEPQGAVCGIYARGAERTVMVRRSSGMHALRAKEDSDFRLPDASR